MNTWTAGKDLKKNHYQAKEDFYSELSKENVTDEDYAHAQKVWDTCKIKKLRQV